MDAEYKHIQGKKKILKDQRKMKLTDLVQKKAKKIEAVKQTFAQKGYETENIEGTVTLRSTLEKKAKKRLQPDSTEGMEDMGGDIEPGRLKRKAIEKTEGMAFKRAQGMSMEKSVFYPTIIPFRLPTKLKAKLNVSGAQRCKIPYMINYRSI